MGGDGGLEERGVERTIGGVSKMVEEAIRDEVTDDSRGEEGAGGGRRVGESGGMCRGGGTCGGG